MDREAAAIRSEMSVTRASLDRKLSELEERAHELTPRHYAQRHLPEYWAEQLIGGALTLAGLWMAFRMYRAKSSRRAHMRAAFTNAVSL
jgi:hypothetical protein